MQQQIFDARSCNGACETEMGCNCWSGVQRVQPTKLTEADLDARRAEKEAATIERRARYMLTADALAVMADEQTITGPYTTTEPTTVTWRQRLERWWRKHIVG
jgi:hypothetical protein